MNIKGRVVRSLLNLCIISVMSSAIGKPQIVSFILAFLQMKMDQLMNGWIDK